MSLADLAAREASGRHGRPTEATPGAVPAEITLARRAVACEGWRWMPGMKLAAGLRLTESLVPFTFPVDLPDLTDPATLGCLLALVREAWGRPTGHILFLGACGSTANGWRFEWSTTNGQFGGGINRYFPTEAEALVAALEAAP